MDIGAGADRLLTALGALCLLLVFSGPAWALDCPHCESAAPGETGFGANACVSCHIGHSATGTSLTSDSSIDNLCRSCHWSGGVGTEVDSHGAVAGQANCDFCTQTFTTVCADCHDPHGHRQPINAAGDPTGAEGRDYFLRSNVKKKLPGAACTDDCPVGSSADGSPAGACVADPVCGTCVGQEVCDDSSGKPICTCPPNRNPADCSTCASGFSGATCTTNDCSGKADSDPCGHGTCSSSGSTPDCSIDCPVGEYNDPTNLGHCTPDETTPTCGSKASAVIYDGYKYCDCPAGYASGCNAGACRTGFTNSGGNCVVSCASAGNACGFGGTCVTGGGGGAVSYDGTTATPVGSVTNPNNALAAGGGSAVITTSQNSSLTVSGFPTSTGTITDVTVFWADYSATGFTSKPDIYTLEHAVNGSTFTTFFTSQAAQALTTRSASLGALSWAQVGTLALRVSAVQDKGVDPITINIDRMYIQVTTSGGGLACNGVCSTGYTGTNCDTCAAGYVAHDGTCITDPCSGFNCNSANPGSCYVDNSGAAECDCSGRYYGSGTGCNLFDAPTCATTGGSVTCVCSAGYGPAGVCTGCLVGYHEEDGGCVADSAGTCSGVSCGGGTCYVDDNSTGAATYFCDCAGRYYSSVGNCDACTATGGTTLVDFVLAAESGADSYADGNATTLGICEACHTQTTHHLDSGNNSPASHNAGTDCIDCHRHTSASNSARAAGYGFIPAPGQGTGTPVYCAGCHLSAPAASSATTSGGFDVDSYSWNGAKATIDYQEWMWYGHGFDARGSGSLPSGNAKPDLDVKGSGAADPEAAASYSTNGNVWLGEHGCAFCHNGSVSHNDPSNYFRLANVTGTAYAENGPCLVCHGDLETGYLGQNSSLKVDLCAPDNTSVAGPQDCCSGAWDGSRCTGNGNSVPWHYGSKHTGATSTGGQFCWDCHDPHGDVDADATPGQALWYMFQRYPVEDSNASDMGTVFDADGDELNGLDGLADVNNDGTPEAIEFRDLGGAPGLDHDEFKTKDSAAGGIGVCRVCHDGTSRFNSAEDDDGHPSEKGTTETACTGCHQHRWGITALTCVNCVAAPENCNDAVQCHGDVTDTTDYWTGTKAKIDLDGASSWVTTGHGLPGASSYASGNPGANFRNLSQGTTAADETLECYYCHEPDLGGTYLGSHQAGTFPPGNRFMLANITGPADANNNCLVCHGLAATGYNPPAHASGDLPLKTATATVGTAHYPTAGHAGATNTGGKYCWNCHDPHGDSNDYMMQDQVWPHNDTSVNDLRPDQTVTPKPVTFNIAGGVNNAALDWDDYRDDGAQTNPLCGACHLNATTGAYALCRSGNCLAHNGPSDPCTACHAHNDDFQGAGDCTGCHSGTKNNRRAVGTDFGAGGSHHIKRTNPPFNKYDCVMCHLEGTSAAATDGVYHKDGDVDLRDADGNSNGSWQYLDDDSVAGDLNPNGLTVNCGAADGGNWKTAMTKYCLACHDANGFGHSTFLSEVLTAESADAAVSPKPTRTALNPFGDTNGSVSCTTNPRHGIDCSQNGMTCDASSSTCRIINVNDQFNPSNFATHSASCWKSGASWVSAFKDATGCPAADCGTSTVGYINPVTFTNNWNTEGNFVTECVDCHMPANTTGTLAGMPYSNNAHASYNTPYLLDTSNATDVATTSTDGTSNTTCFRCHVQAQYMERNNSSRYEPHSKGTSHTSPGYTQFGTETGIGCFACHGGRDDGDIHGENDTVEGSGTNAVIFLNGGSIKWWQVSAKSGAPTYSCGDGATGPYNLGCGNHDTAGGGQSYPRAY